MSNADDFIQEYKELKNLCRCKYGFSVDGKAISKLIAARKFPEYEKELLWCKDM